MIVRVFSALGHGKSPASLCGLPGFLLMRRGERRGVAYRSSESTFCCDWLACDSIAVEA
jgi:hypothetical protein